MKQLNINIQDYVEIVFRQKWFIIVPFILITLGGTLRSYRLPAVYRASTLILVQKQRVPEAYIKATVTGDIAERLHGISQEIMSRTRLEAIINELDLYPALRKSLFMEEVVEKMRRDITLEVKGKEAFQLFYDGKEPRVVATVANRLASFFIEENLKMREDLAEGTTEFLDRELLRVKSMLEELENAIRTYKERNLGALPQQLDANLRAMDQLQMQLQTVSTSLENARERKISLQNQVSALSNLQSQLDTDFVGIEPAESDPTLANLRALLAKLLVKYKDKHPDVIRVKSQIQRLEEELESEEEDTLAGEGEEEAFATSSGDDSFNFYDTMGLEVESVDLEIRRLREEQEKIKEKLVLYQKRIEDTPKREQELYGLQRDYDNTQKNYESLLDKKLNAQLASNMEKVQKGERFKILDPARIPEKPFKPNRPRIIQLALLLGLGCGMGLAFGVEYLDQSFRDVDELEKFAGLPVLASIPTIMSDRDLQKRKTRMKIAVAVSSLGLLAVIIAFAVFHFFIR